MSLCGRPLGPNATCTRLRGHVGQCVCVPPVEALTTRRGYYYASNPNRCACRPLPGGGSGWNSDCPVHGERATPQSAHASQNEQSVESDPLPITVERITDEFHAGRAPVVRLSEWNAIRCALSEREELLAEIRASHEMLRDKTEEGAGEPPRLLCKCRFCLVGDST